MSSTPSTPRTARTASRANSPEMLTPGRKIKAMLAAFDSDSDSDNGGTASKPDRSTTTLSNALKNSTISTQPTTTLESDGDDDEDDIVMPKGRMAARLQAQAHNQNPHASNSGQTAFERVSKTLRSEKQEADRDAVMDDADESNDDLPTAGPRRRGMTAASRTPQVERNGSDRSPSPARSDSPLFVSSPIRDQDDDESQAGSGDDEGQPKANSRFLALVAQKRKEREEKEKAEAEKRAARAKQHEQFSSEILSGSESEGENGSGRKLTQQARPARKASKKALEEMNRETQRMSRNMQLAHQAQTKKKITKESFFARFKSKQSEEQPVAGPSGENSSTTAGSRNSSDAEAQKGKETPRTSPVLGPTGKASGEDLGKETEVAGAEEEEFPTLEELLANPRPQPEQTVVTAMEIDGATPQPGKASTKKDRREVMGPPVRVRLTREEVARQQKDDSDSELEIVTSPAKCRRIAAFENVPARKVQESASLMKLKALAHLTSPTRKSTMNPAQLSATVLLKARQQAAKERQDRIQELRAKGIHIETAEERAAMEDELENLVEKARKEAEDIAKMERKASKGEDEDDDDDWDYSGSEEEADEEDGDEEEENEEAKPAAEEGLVDSEAGEGDESEDDQTEVMSVDEKDVPTRRRKRPTRTVIDDDDEDDDETEPKTPAKSIVTPTTRSVERPHLPTQSSSNLMSLTQAFAGTIAGSHQDNEGGNSTISHSLPEPGFDHQESDSQMIIKDSQEPRAESVDLLAGYSQSVARVSESPAPRSTQPSQVPDPTQDAGFVFSPFDPSKRFLGTPQSTIETVVINRDDQDSSPAPTRRMKQLKRGRMADLSMIEEQEEGEGEGDFEIDASAFDIMKKASKKPAIPFDRNKSKAKDIVEEAAEESDDEYAGLGGASDEDEDVENAYDRQMINDNSGETVDEKQLAALNALHQRNTDEKQVAKLLKDITTGALRRRRNADDEFDLDDSDDELLARRREKQREFARMRKALLADEKIGEIAENPKKAAFFRAVEDRDDDDDDIGFDFLDDEQQQQQDSQTDDQSSQDPATTTTSTTLNPRKRPLEPTSEETYNRPPPHLRRKPASAMSKKPATLAEIRETLSFLTETHDYDSFHEDASMDDAPDHDEDEAEPEDETEDTQPPDFEPAPHQQQDGEILPASQRLHPRRTRGPVVDRLALLRQASSNSATSNTGNRLAFHSGSGSGSVDGTGFTRPPLLRKTTTGSTSSATSSTISSRAKSRQSSTTSSVSTGGGGGGSGGGGKKGAVNYYTAAREQERERQLRLKERGSSGGKISALLDKHARNRLGQLGGKGQWE
ncbi:uncharacterized protein BO80DRAFT_498251 [Aspergillus ibericus CBS 121593]|uniref:DNA replication checkpoint mediator MRC1 domain-containing protein n=1 Tax=Aspergillus ibericus CBS 121593 TaxID=1448316 RepID=A0A395HF14_9EURO|nr:hypothetical protein BO80DRAFT_498251 [Aspergillus ibericus CBS 121593]RAL06099.1 hypothetical protein BO80DRAFT_498251 [Aspergillus ibericus CBS 121593]